MRDSMIFYRSFFEAINELPDENQLEVYKSIFEYSLNFKELEIKGLSKTIFTLIKPQLEANNKRFINGKQPKHKQELSEDEAKDKQELSEMQANNNNNNNVNNNNNENENLKEKFNFKNSLLELGIEKTIAEDWIKVRKEKKAVNTQTAFETIKNEIGKCSISANECIKLAVQRSWGGFKSEWIKNTPINPITQQTKILHPSQDSRFAFGVPKDLFEDFKKDYPNHLSYAGI